MVLLLQTLATLQRVTMFFKYFIMDGPPPSEGPFRQSIHFKTILYQIYFISTQKKTAKNNIIHPRTATSSSPLARKTPAFILIKIYPKSLINYLPVGNGDCFVNAAANETAYLRN